MSLSVGNNNQDDRRSTEWIVLAALVMFFGTIFVANGALVYYALSTFSGEQEASPYEHGLAYDRDIESARQQDARGWNVTLGVQRAEPGAPASIAVGMRDANNEALGGLEVSAGLEFPTDKRFDRRIGLIETGPGEYLADLPLRATVVARTVMTRDEYVTDLEQCLLDSYDDQARPWGLTHRDAWKQVATRPFVAGTMVWTGFDYRGEPQPLSWPAAGSSFGIMDLCGFPKAAYYIHQAQWIQDRPLVHIVPHWNWAGSEGKPIKVMVTSNLEKVELRLNGKPVGEKAVDKYEMATFEVPYTAGKLEAVASGSKGSARFTVETTGAPAALRLVSDRASLAGDGDDAQPVTVEVVDSQGRVVPTANPLVKFALTGPGAIIGLNNGDPTNHEPEKGNLHTVFHGLAQVIVQSGLGGQGKLTLTAASEGLATGETVIVLTPTAARPAVPVIPNPPLVVLNWIRSPVTAERLDPNQPSVTSAMTSWDNVHPGSWLTPFHDGRFAIYRANFTPRAATQKTGGQLLLRDVVGKAQVFVDGKVAGEKAIAGKGDMTVAFPTGGGERTVSVVIEAAAPDEPAGLGGIVTVE